MRARLYTLAARTRKVREAVEEMPPCEAQKLVPGYREPDRHLTNLELLLTEVADQLASPTIAQIKRSGGRSSRARGACGGGTNTGVRISGFSPPQPTPRPCTRRRRQVRSY